MELLIIIGVIYMLYRALKWVIKSSAADMEKKHIQSTQETYSESIISAMDFIRFCMGISVPRLGIFLSTNHTIYTVISDGNMGVTTSTYLGHRNEFEDWYITEWKKYLEAHGTHESEALFEILPLTMSLWHDDDDYVKIEMPLFIPKDIDGFKKALVAKCCSEFGMNVNIRIL